MSFRALYAITSIWFQSQNKLVHISSQGEVCQTQETNAQTL